MWQRGGVGVGEVQLQACLDDLRNCDLPKSRQWQHEERNCVAEQAMQDPLVWLARDRSNRFMNRGDSGPVKNLMVALCWSSDPNSPFCCSRSSGSRCANEYWARKQPAVLAACLTQLRDARLRGKNAGSRYTCGTASFGMLSSASGRSTMAKACARLQGFVTLSRYES